MKKEKNVKILTIVVCLILAIELFIKFLELKTSNSSVDVGLYLFHILPFLLISIILIIYGIKSITNIIQKKAKITFIDILILVFFIYNFISNLLMELFLHMQG